MELSLAKAAEIRSSNGPVLYFELLGEQRVVTLDREMLSIGADDGCDIQLTSSGLAGRQCLVQKSDAGWEVFALAADNPTSVNGQTVEAAPLHSGDCIEIGRVVAHVVDPTADFLPAGFQLVGVPSLAPPSQPSAHQAHLSSTHDNFSEALLDALRQTPWVVLSGAIHSLIYVLLLLVLEEDVKSTEPPINLESELADLSDEAELAEDEETLDISDVEEEEVELPEVAEISEMEQVAQEFLQDDVQTDLDELRGESMVGAGSMTGLDSDQVGGRLGGPGSRSMGRKLRSTVGRLKESGLDVVVLLDATGSMDDEIDAARGRIGEMITLVQSFGINFRLGIVAFRDKGDEYVVRSSPLTPNRYKAVDFMDSLEANGGGDRPEAVYEAVLAGTRMRWSPRAERVIVLVGDAPPQPQTKKKLYKLVEHFAQRKGHFHTIYTETDAGGGIDLHQTRQVFRHLAERGGGSAIELRREAQIVEDILLLTLESTNRDEIHRLIREVDSGLKGKILKRRLEKHDAAFAAKQLRRQPMDPLVPLLLSRYNHRDFLPAFLGVLRDKSTSISNRWLVTVLLRRLLRHIDSYQDLGASTRELIQDYDPDKGFGRQKQILQKLGKRLYDQGLLPELDEPNRTRSRKSGR